jgi:drug/metabolite transporter (DMT)-like permease
VTNGSQKLVIVAAFAAIYLIWGSTYFAIRVGLETLPPFLMAGTRFLVAGVALYGWLRLRGVPRPTDSQWWEAALTGTLMLACGVGGVTWAEQQVPSGVAALLVTTVPMWMTLIDTLVLRQTAFSARLVFGLVLGTAGVVALVAPSRGEMAGIDPVGAAVILAGALAWSVGSLRSRRAELPKQPAMTVAIQMVTAGVVLLVVSSMFREWQQGFALSEVSLRSSAALAYLAVAGSMVTLCAYVWLLRTVAASAVATYAFVNPVVAVYLGWAFAGEAAGPRVLAATALIVTAVVIIQSMQWRQASIAGARVSRKEERLNKLPGYAQAVGSAAASLSYTGSRAVAARAGRVGAMQQVSHREVAAADSGAHERCSESC